MSALPEASIHPSPAEPNALDLQRFAVTNTQWVVCFVITKLLFTALIVVGVIFYTRYRAEARQRPVRKPQPAPVSPRVWRYAPVGALLAVLVVSAFIFWLEWREDHRLFTVRVVDTRSGEIRQYAVYPDAVNGRSFTTVDGRVVTLADVERMELVEGAPSGP